MLLQVHPVQSTVKPSRRDTAEQAHFGAQDIGWQALGPAIACVLLATSVVIARWFARRKLAKCEGLDDCVILISLSLSWVMTALIAVEVNGGMGVYAGPVEIQTIAKLVIASNCLWVMIVNITKASILIQYLRIFSSRTIGRICYLFLFLLIPAASWAIFGGVFLCSPIAKLWNPELPGHCISAQKYWLSVAGADIALDFLILLLPLPAITGLHLPRKQKLGLIMVFALGFLVCLVSVARLLAVLISSNQGHHVKSGIWAIVWSAVEANVGIICASLLSLKPLVVKLFPNLARETMPPRHSLRLALVAEDGDSWRDETKAFPASLSSPTRPSTAWSNTTLAVRNASVGRPGSPYPRHELGVCEMEQPAGVLLVGDSGGSRI